MARARNIKPGFFINEAVVELPFEYRLLFIGLWTLADREGRLENRPKKIKMAIFPADDVNIEEGIRCLHRACLVLCYTVGNEQFIYIPSFVKHQSPHVKEAESTIPPPEHRASTGLAPDEHPLNPEPPLPNPESLTPTIADTSAGDVLEIFTNWQKLLNHPGAILDKKRLAIISARLKHFTVEQLKLVPLGVLKSPHHMGDNRDGKKFDGIETVYRDAGQVEKFIEYSKIEGSRVNGQNNGHHPTNSGDRNAQRINNTKQFIAELRRQGAEEEALLGGNDVGGSENDQSFKSAAAERDRPGGQGG